MQWVADPAFMQREPARRVQLALLCTLLWVALPLLWSLPAGVTALFAILWLLRLGLWHWRIRPLPWLWLLLLLLAAVVVVWQQLGTVIGREGGVAFLLLLTMLKAYESRGRRDWQVLLLAMLVVMGGAVLFHQHLAMAAWLLAGLCWLCLDMALLAGLAFFQAARQAALALALALPPALLLFVAVPRVAEPLWRIPQPDEQRARTGLSEHLEPGSISELVQSNALAFHATFAPGQQPAAADLYWRVMVMADFDGRQWRAVDERYTDEARPQAGAQSVDYQLIIRDEAGRIPALDYPLGGQQSGLEQRLGAVLRVTRSREGLRRIRLRSAPGAILPHRLAAGEQAYYTHLPADGNPQARALAQQWRASGGDARQLANRALAYFRAQGFVYTLRPQRRQVGDRVDFFLFSGREGFCEDYAHAFVYLMRAAGVPARIVTGYQGGDYDEAGQFWQVRGQHAHAWAEVWLAAENAWLRVDPTAAVASVRVHEGLGAALPEDERSVFLPRQQWWYRLGQRSQFYWQQWVVNFDANRQQNLFRRLGFDGVNVGSVSVLVLGGGAVALLPLLWWWRRQQRRRQQPLHAGWAYVQATLLNDGDAACPVLGPRELARCLKVKQCWSTELQALLNEYERYVYVDERLPGARCQRQWQRRVRRAVARLRRVR